MLSYDCQSLGLETATEPVLFRTVIRGLLCVYLGDRLYGRKAERIVLVFLLACSIRILFFFFFHSESKQWESLTSECRVLLIESLATLETDSRPELQEKASLLKKTLENLE